MSRQSLILTVITAIILGFSPVFFKVNALKTQKQGWIEQFQLINKRIALQENKLNSISQHLEKQYEPFIDASLSIKSYGIGGQVDHNVLGDREIKLIRDNYKRIRINYARAMVLEHKLDLVKNIAIRIKDSLRHTPNIHPVPIDSVRTISSFGLRRHPILHVWKMHEGIDYGCEVGTPVYATADGIVVFSGYDPITGQYIKIEHGYGYTTLYGHLSRRLVVRGEKVHKGELIGFSGNTGRSEGPHLHYEVRLFGQHVNPVKFIADPIGPELETLHSRRSMSFYIAR